jgi:hypothetical protein
LSGLALLVAAGCAAPCLLPLLGAGEGSGELSGQLSREELLEGWALPLLLLVVVVLRPLGCSNPSRTAGAAATLPPREAGRCRKARRRRPAAKVLRRPRCALLLPRVTLLPRRPSALLLLLLLLLLLPCMRRAWRLWRVGGPQLLRPLLIRLLLLLLLLLLLPKAREPSRTWPAVAHAPSAIGAAGAAACSLTRPRPWMLLLLLLLRMRLLLLRLCQAQLLQKETGLWPARGARWGPYGGEGGNRRQVERKAQEVFAARRRCAESC